MFGWQLHIKAKCKVKLAYTAVFIMLPLPAQTFFPLQSLSLARVRQPPNSNFYSLSLLHSSFMSFTRSSTERDQDVRQLNYSLQWSLYLSSLSIESCKRRRTVCTHASERFSKVLLDSANLTKGGSRFITVLLLTDGWENEVTSLVLRGARAINWKAHITRCSGWPSAPIWFL